MNRSRDACVNSTSLRKASVTNSREKLELEREKKRLQREFAAQQTQMRAAQNRFAIKTEKRIIDVKSIKTNAGSSVARHGSSTLPPILTNTLATVKGPRVRSLERFSSKSDGSTDRDSSQNSALPFLKAIEVTEKVVAEQKASVRKENIVWDIDEDKDTYMKEEILKRLKANAPRSGSSRSIHSSPQLRRPTLSEDFTTNWDIVSAKPQLGRRYSLQTLSPKEQAERLEWEREKRNISFKNTSLRTRVRFVAAMTKFAKDPVVEEDELNECEEDINKTWEDIRKCRYIWKKPADDEAR